MIADWVLRGVLALPFLVGFYVLAKITLYFLSWLPVILVLMFLR